MAGPDVQRRRDAVNLTFTPFAAMKLVAITVTEPVTGAPRHVRVVDAAVARVVRRLALDPHVPERTAAGTEASHSRHQRSDGETRRDATDRDAARLDALITHAESSGDPGPHECGGA